MVWNEETIRLLRDLWAEGHSTAEIGRRLGVSKNAIVGKAHRLDLDARPSPIRREGAKPPADRGSTWQRVAGPTLPPLASASAPSLVVPQTSVQPIRPAAAPATLGVARPTLSGIGPNVPSPTGPGSFPHILSIAQPEKAPPPRHAPQPRFQARRPAPSCCWPIGDPGTKTFRFCDDISLPGKPYCDDHAKLAYVKIRDRKEDAA